MAQEGKYPKDYFRSPLNMEISLSGTFGEIRPNHYHSGADIRVGGVVGAPVYATADGYVSRISISPWGGGKVLYIDHDNGFRTVYMHLNDFVGEIGACVRNYQYKHERFSFNAYFPKDSIRVEKGQVVAHAGNTGSSAGPHLHYEVRYAYNDQVINPFYFGLPYKDNVKPIIRGVMIYPEKGKGIKVTGDTVRVGGKFYAGIYATDLSGPGSGKNGVEKIELWVNNVLWFVYQTETFKFEETRSMNSCIDYPHYKATREYYIVSRRLPGMRNDNHRALKNDGYIDLKRGEVKHLKFRVSDYKGNCVVKTFCVKGIGMSADEENIDVRVHGKVLRYDQMNEVAYDECKVKMMPYTIYDNDELVYNVAKDSRFLSMKHTVRLKNHDIPPHYKYELRLKVPSMGEDDLMVVVNVKGNRYSACPTRRQGEWLVAEVKTFGDFAVMQDIVAPLIRPLNFSSGNTLKSQVLRVKITDNLSGLKHYACYVNGKWALGEYDGKSATMTVKSTCLKQGKNSVLIEAEDAVGNRSEKNYFVYR